MCYTFLSQHELGVSEYAVFKQMKSEVNERFVGHLWAACNAYIHIAM